LKGGIDLGGAMETEFARQYYESAQAGHWWFEGRSLLVRELLDRQRITGGLALDLGAGSESLLPDGLKVVKLDLVRPQGRLGTFVIGSALRLPFPDARFRLVGAFDLIEHVAKAARVIAEARRVLVPGGIFIATVPAHQWLWSPHDERVGHVRRYHPGAVVDLVEEGGLQVLWCSPFYGFLLAPAIARKILRLSSTMGTPPHQINSMLTRLAQWSVRRALARPRLGLSIGVLAAKPDEPVFD
jgi:SAM-dependent methyltransferase